DPADRDIEVKFERQPACPAMRPPRRPEPFFDASTSAPIRNRSKPVRLVSNVPLRMSQVRGSGDRTQDFSPLRRWGLQGSRITIFATLRSRLCLRHTFFLCCFKVA